MSSLCSSLWGYSTEQDRRDPALLGLPFTGLDRRNKDKIFSSDKDPEQNKSHERVAGVVQGTISRMVRQGVSEEMTFQPRCKWRKGAATW